MSMMRMSNTSSEFLLFLSLLAIICFSSLPSFRAATTTHPDEIKALEVIGKTLGKDWNFDVDPCSNKTNWVTPEVPPKITTNNVTCNCSVVDDNFCHVTMIVLKGQNLSGTLPPELNTLHYLQILDLSRNLLNGTIPKEWGSMINILNITLPNNRLTGSIPMEISNISTLQALELSTNRLSGKLPPELGNLSQILLMRLNSNNFTGELPETLAKLTRLKDFRIADNQFSGRIPNFIQSWTSLEALMIQGTGLSGPIPSGISLLTKLIDLRISDLNGSEYSPFPKLHNMTSLKNLILRNCNINGTLPSYIGTIFKTLYVLDLSFNKLSGPIPNNYPGILNVNFIFLTGNLLTGSDMRSSWRNNIDVDLSYNNLSIGNQEVEACQHEKVNLFASSRNDSGAVSCLSSSSCTKSLYAFHINCGGKETNVEGTTYDYDSLNGPATSYESPSRKWAVSTTGIFMDGNQTGKYYHATNITKLSMANTELYTNARVSPISLTYYGYCLENGHYTTKLYFAEIMFTDDQTYSSQGRRVFDIYLQGNLVKKDYNIAEAAGGVGKEVIETFNSVVVTNNTLEIRLYWAGKGTTNLPRRSVYGPLISAISVESNSPPGGKRFAGVVVGIVAAGVAVVIILVFVILWWKGCFGKKNSLAID